MAKKTTEVDNGKLRFDHELDFNFDEFEIQDVTKNKKKRAPVHDVMRGMADATKSKLKTAGFWDNLARKALPESYKFVSDEVKKSKDTLTEAFRDSARTLKPELSRIGRQVDALVPQESKRLKRWTSKLAPEERSYDAPSAETLQNQGIAMAQAEIFDKIHQASDAREARSLVESRIRDKIDTKRFTTSINILAGMQQGIARIAAYTTTVNAAYQKKSLELQFRSYHVQAELLRETVKNNQVFRSYFEAIKENTALPDFVKITKTEMFKQQALAKIFEGVNNSFSAGVQRLGKRVKNFGREALDRAQQLSQGLEAGQAMKDSLQMAKELGMDESPYYNVPAMGGGILIDWLVDRYGPNLRKLFPRGGKVSKGLAWTSRNMQDTSHLAKNLRGRQGLNDWRNSDNVIKRMMGDAAYTGLGDFIAPERDKVLTKGRQAGEIEMAHFDKRVHKSITEVIPGFLARILQETSSIRTGMNLQQLDMPTYDWKRSKFTDSKTLRKKIIDELIEGNRTQNMNWQLGQTSKMMVGEELTGPNAKRMKDFIHKLITKDDFEFTPENIMQSREFQDLLPHEQKKLRAQFSRVNKSEEGREFFSGNLNKLRASANEQTNNLMSQMEMLLREMDPEQLEKAGLTVENESGGQSINLPKVLEMIRTQGVLETSKRPEPPPMNADGEQPDVGPIPGWEYRPNLKRYVKKSDRNVKTNIRSEGQKSILERLKSLNIFSYNYKGKHADGQRHVGPMAQDVKKQFGDKAAPGGTSIDDREMTALHSQAIKELSDKVDGSEVNTPTVFLLKSIDRRLKDLTIIAKIGVGGNPEGADGRGLFGDTVNLAGRYSKMIMKHGRRGAKRGMDFIWGSGEFIRDKIAKPVGNTVGEFYDDHKDSMKAGVTRLLNDLIKLTGTTYDKASNFISQTVPNSIQYLKNIWKRGMERASDFLSKPRDFYIPGLDSPVLVGELFTKGMYVDSEGKPILDIETLKKVKGAIYKKTGEVVVTAEQLAEGLYDRYGNKLKNLATSVSGLAAGAVGWVGGKFMEGVDRVKGVFNKMVANRMEGKGALKGIFGGLGFGGGSSEMLEKIYRLMLKWDKKGMGDEESGGGSVSVPQGDPQWHDPDTLGPVGASSVSAPPGQAGDGFGAMSKIGDSVRGMLKSDKLKAAIATAKQTKGVRRLGTLGGKLGKLGGGRLGKFGGKMKGKLGGLMTLASSVIGSGQSGDPNQTPQDDTADKAGIAATPPPLPQQEEQKQDTKAGFMKSVSQMLGHVRGKAAWNDKDGSGRRDGDFRDKLDALAEQDKNRPTAQNIRAPEGKAGDAFGVFGMFKNLFSTLTSGVGSLFSLAGSTLGSLGGIGKIFGGAGKLFGKSVSGLGKVAGFGGRMLGKVGAPLTRGIGRLATTGAGRVVAGTLARTAALSGAAAMATGGVGSAVLGAVSAGLAGLGAIVASPVVMGALATGAAAYGGYKLYKHFTRNNTDEFQKFRYMQYGFGSNEGDSYNHKLGALESYLLSEGRVGYQAQFSGSKIAYLYDKKIDPKELAEMFDVDVNDNEETTLFTNWFQYRFKPFFLNTLTSLFNANPKVSLHNAAEKLKPEERKKFLEGAKFASSSAYDYMQPPLKSMGMLGSYKDEVMSIIDGLIEGAGKKKTGKDGKGEEKPKSLMDKVKSAAQYATPIVGAAALAKKAWGAFEKTEIGGKIKDQATKIADQTAKVAADTGKRMLKYLKDKDIPAEFKKTILGLGSSVLATYDKGGTLMKAAMIALVPGLGLVKGAKALMDTKVGKAMGSAAESLYNKVTDLAGQAGNVVSKVAGSVADKVQGAIASGKEAYGQVVQMTSEGMEKAANFVSKNYDKALGFISSKYESGKRGVKTISTGAGDHGGVSYGRYQLASKNGSMGAFLSSPEGSKFIGQFQGLKIGSPAFNQKYMEIANTDPEGFDKAQHDYIARTHYDKAVEKLNKGVSGLNLVKRGRAVHEAVFSTSVQYGPGSNVMVDALKDKDVSKMTDEQIVSAIQDHKARTVDSKFRSSSPAVRASVSQRIMNEKMDLIALARQTGGAVPAAANDATTPSQIKDKLTPAGTPATVATAPAAANDPSKAVAALTGKSIAPPTPGAASANANMSRTQNGQNQITTSIAPPTPTTATAPQGAGVVKTSNAPAANDAPTAAPATLPTTGGDYSPTMSSKPTKVTTSAPSEITAVSPTLSSSRTKRVDSGENVMHEISEAAKSSLNIQTQQLNVMIEVRDRLASIDEYIRLRGSSKLSQPTPPPSRMNAPRVDQFESVIDNRRRRS